MILLQLFCLAGLAIAALGWFISCRTIVRRRFVPARKRGISILKPIKGVDEPGLMSNIISFLFLDYHRDDELIFCMDGNGPEFELIKRFKDLYPQIPIRISTIAVNRGVNPKIQNIWNGYIHARNDLILISDANVSVPSNYLNVCDYEMKANVNILTAAIHTVSSGLWSDVEAMLLHRFYNKWLLILNHLGFGPIVMGKSMLFRREQLDARGGLERICNYLAEDYNTGQALGRVKVMSIPITQHITGRDFSGMAGRYVRWGRMRKAQAPLAFAAELLSSMSAMSLVAMFVFPWWQGMIINTVWCWFEVAQIKHLGSKSKFIPFMVSEWMMIPLWLLTLSGNKVEWRGNIFKMKRGGKCVKSLS